MDSGPISRIRSNISGAGLVIGSIISRAGLVICRARSVPPGARLIPVLMVLVALLVAGCGAAGASSAGKGQILAVGAENEYADVISQIGGRYVRASAILSDPNTDPHTFEASPSVAGTVSAAQLIVQNGLGYDDFMKKIESASPNADRKVIEVQHLLGLPGSTRNPHLWYMPTTMPAVAKAVAAELSRLQPSHAAYFRANEASFDRSLSTWYDALKQFRSRYPGAPVAVTEPVGDYMLQAAGTAILTPYSLEAALQNGVDPAPQAVSRQNELLSGRKVKVLLYNQQVTDSLTNSFLKAARAHHIPIVGVYETMPAGGYDYQSWMRAEIGALQKAVAQGISTEKL
jgi:zinc/manganese transport system substrate-binding protein